MATMNISLPAPLAEWIEERIRNGQYANASDYIGEPSGRIMSGASGWWAP